jgi:hypothetical protein
MDESVKPDGFKSDVQNLALVAGAVGVLTGAIGAYDKPGSSFVAVSGQVSVMTLLPVWAMSGGANGTFTDFQIGAANGALMAVKCYAWHGFGLDSTLKYGLLVGSLTFGALTLLGTGRSPPEP